MVDDVQLLRILAKEMELTHVAIVPDAIERCIARLEAADRLRGSIGLAYISESAVFRFIGEYDAAEAPVQSEAQS